MIDFRFNYILCGWLLLLDGHLEYLYKLLYGLFETLFSCLNLLLQLYEVTFDALSLQFDEQKDQVAIEQILRVIFLDPERPSPVSINNMSIIMESN